MTKHAVRLQASLDLMPTAAWYDEQRAGNQRLLDRLKAATGSAGQSPNHESNGETL